MVWEDMGPPSKSDDSVVVIGSVDSTMRNKSAKKGYFLFQYHLLASSITMMGRYSCNGNWIDAMNSRHSGNEIDSIQFIRP